MVDKKSNSTYETVDKEFVKAVLIREMAERLAKDIRSLCSAIMLKKDRSQRKIALTILAQTFAELKVSELSAVTNELIFSAFQSSQDRNDWLIEESRNGISIVHECSKQSRFWGSLIPFSKPSININVLNDKVLLRYRNLWQVENITINRQIKD
jgi:hypothetical protein